MNWLVRPWRLTFDFSGRSPRREWALFLATYYGVVILLGTAGMALGPGVEQMSGVLILIWFLACIIPAISLGVRRLHDHNKTGWLLLITFVPLFGWVFYLIMMLTGGDEEANEYGHNPRYGEQAADETAEIFA